MRGNIDFVNSFMSCGKTGPRAVKDVVWGMCGNETYLDHKTVALGAPRDDVLEGLVLEHPAREDGGYRTR
jgi:hypothetical protein